MNNYFVALNNCVYINELLDLMLDCLDSNYLLKNKLSKDKIHSLIHQLIKNITVHMLSVDKTMDYVDIDFLTENSRIWNDSDISKKEAADILGLTVGNFRASKDMTDNAFYRMYGIRDGYIGVCWAVIFKLVENSTKFNISLNTLLTICAFIKLYLINLSNIDDAYEESEQKFVLEYTDAIISTIKYSYNDAIIEFDIDKITEQISLLYKNLYDNKLTVDQFSEEIYNKYIYSKNIVKSSIKSSPHISKPLEHDALNYIKDNVSNSVETEILLDLKDIISYSQRKKDKNNTTSTLDDSKNKVEDNTKEIPAVSTNNSITPKTVTNTQTNTETKEQKEEIPETLDELISQVNELIGLENVKQDINDIVNLVKIRNLRKQNNLPVPDMSFHLVFTGNPGTGKTTIARLLSKIYAKLEVVSDGQLIEVDRSGLVAGYVGQTAIKVKEQIDKAIGGVLFIDEAYTLTVGDNNDFAEEAIATLLKNMEDNRDNLVVIVAGYTDLMEKFINSNPGLKSRFNKYINFKDYALEEMLDIFKLQCKKSKLTINKETEKAVIENIKKKLDENKETFANARGVRNYFEKVLVKQANRLVQLDSNLLDAKSLQEITVDDVNC